MLKYNSAIILREAWRCCLEAKRTFSSFTFSHQECSPLVPRVQQQPLSVFTSHFTKVPPIKWKNPQLSDSDEVRSCSCYRLYKALLFSLDWISRGHVIARDVAFPPCGDGSGLPPISFSATTTYSWWRETNASFIQSRQSSHTRQIKMMNLEDRKGNRRNPYVLLMIWKRSPFVNERSSDVRAS